MAASPSLLATLTICLVVAAFMADHVAAARNLAETVATLPQQPIPVPSSPIQLPDLSSIVSALAAYFPQFSSLTNPTLPTNPTVPDHEPSQAAATTEP